MYSCKNKARKEREKEREREREREKEKNNAHNKEKFIPMLSSLSLSLSIIYLAPHTTANQCISPPPSSLTLSFSPLQYNITFRYIQYQVSTDYTLPSSLSIHSCEHSAENCHSHFLPLFPLLSHSFSLSLSQILFGDKVQQNFINHLDLACHSYPFILPSAPSVDEPARFPGRRARGG